MEREKIISSGYLLTGDVVEILQTNYGTLNSFVKYGIVKPSHDSMRHGMSHWKLEDVFRVFLGLRLVDEFKEQYGNKNRNYMYDQIRNDLLSTKRTRGQEIIESEEWGAVVEKAAEKGLNLLNLQKVEFNGGLTAED